MKDYYYYQAFRKTTVQFLDLFNDIQIVRYDQGGNFVKYVQVPIKYAPKEKIWFWLNERKDDEMLPVMSAALTGVDYSLERATNKHQKLSCSNADGTVSQFLNPVPYDLSFSVSLWTLYMADIDQILEQILPWFQPYVMIRVHSPELNSTFDIKTIFSSATPEIDFEYTDDTFRILKYTLDFTVQTYMFKPMETVGIIKSILVNYYTNEETFNARPERLDSTFSSGASGEAQSFTSVPPWFTVDSDPIYDYELFSMGDRVGGENRVLVDMATAPVSAYDEYTGRTESAIITAGYTTVIQVPSAAGIEHINHDVRIQESSGDLQTWVPCAAIPSAGYWIDHDE